MFGCLSVRRIAAGPTEVRACSKAEMLAALVESPQTMLALLEQITHLLCRARAMRELRNVRSAEDRLLHHLHLSAPKDGAFVFDRPQMPPSAGRYLRELM